MKDSGAHAGATSFLVLSPLFAWLDARFLRLPMMIEVMAFALGRSLLLVVLNAPGLLKASRTLRVVYPLRDELKRLWR